MTTLRFLLKLLRILEFFRNTLTTKFNEDIEDPFLKNIEQHEAIWMLQMVTFNHGV